MRERRSWPNRLAHVVWFAKRARLRDGMMSLVFVVWSATVPNGASRPKLLSVSNWRSTECTCGTVPQRAWVVLCRTAGPASVPMISTRPYSTPAASASVSCSARSSALELPSAARRPTWTLEAERESARPREAAAHSWLAATCTEALRPTSSAAAATLPAHSARASCQALPSHVATWRRTAISAKPRAASPLRLVRIGRSPVLQRPVLQRSKPSDSASAEAKSSSKERQGGRLGVGDWWRSSRCWRTIAGSCCCCCGGEGEDEEGGGGSLA
mmetsp:Transcript_37753/g.106069  ORF Transcript_37753/g.106069 Transcript_37753/m.106069 type:complete len:271 (+) Transcript_37753:1471-2283(+)